VAARSATPASTEPRMKLMVSASHRLSMCPLYLAYESGYFADAGFEVEVTKDIGTAQSLPLLAGGKLDASFTSFGPPVVNAAVRGARVQVVAGRELILSSCGTAGTIFLSRKAFPQGVRNMRQLQGARIAISSSSPQTGFWLETLLQHEGMQLIDVAMRKMREIERIAALRAGALEAFVSTEADLNPELLPLGLIAGPSVARVLPNYQYSHIIFGSRLLDGRVEIGARFLRAYFRSADEFLEGRTPRFLQDYARENNLDPTLLRHACRATFERDGTIHINDMQRYTEWMAAHEMCPVNLDATAFADTRFLKAARSMK
jgi:NitT/TauT family transport system substrate-binding protein